MKVTPSDCWEVISGTFFALVVALLFVFCIPLIVWDYISDKISDKTIFDTDWFKRKK